MSFCNKCGNQLAADARFCGKCGTAISLPNQVSNVEILHQSNQRKQVFEGAIHKCPSCGTVLGAFQAVCPDCGFEIREQSSTNSVKEFMTKLDEIENSDENNSAIGAIGSMFLGSFAKAGKKATRKANFISTYPVPNTRADLTEFFLITAENFDAKCAATLFPTGTKYGSMQEFKERQTVERAWLAKMETVYKKAKLSFGSDPSFNSIEEMYQQKKAEFRKAKKRAFIPIYCIIAFFVGVFVIFPLVLTFTESGKTGTELETERLQAIVKEVETIIENKDYDSALLKLTNLNWTYNPEYHEKDIEQWDKQREDLKNTIENLKKQTKKK